MNKCVVFDLDETIGYFAQLYKISKIFENNYKLVFEKHHIISLYKEFYNIFRPGIFTLLAYVQYLKEKYNIQTILYTNTIMDNIWVDAFSLYAYEMVKLQFDTIIYLNSKCRSTIKKNLPDLYKCNPSLNHMSSIMIIDNKEHKHLKYKNIEYILVKNYFFIHNNQLIWEKIHNLLNINIKINVKNNIVNDDYNIILRKNTKTEILSIISKIKLFSKK
tara:strand:- start:5173 stop:5826 length:654 start_codon:yes stop_codon:yes gene_type:complete